MRGATDLKPEFTDNREVGLEMQFLNNSIGFDFSYYQINSKDVVNPVLVERLVHEPAPPLLHSSKTLETAAPSELIT